MSAKRSVAIVTGSLSPTYGAARVAMDLASGLAHSFDVTIVTHDGLAQDQLACVPAGCDHVHIARSPHILGWLGFIWRLRSYMRRAQSMDAYIGFLTYTNFALIIAHRLAGVKGILAVTEHSIQSRALVDMGRLGEVALAMMSVVYRFVDHIICVSEAVMIDLTKNCRVAEAKCTVVYNPIDSINLLVRAKGSLSEDDAKLARSTNIACIAALKPVKQHRLLFDAMMFVPSSCELILIGDGPSREDLIDYAAELGLQDRVHFLGRRENPWPIVSALGATVLATTYEGFGLAVAESASVGTLPIGVGRAGLSEALQLTGGVVISPAHQDLASELGKEITTGLQPGASEFERPTDWLASRVPEMVAGEYARVLFP